MIVIHRTVVDARDCNDDCRYEVWIDGWPPMEIDQAQYDRILTILEGPRVIQCPECHQGIYTSSETGTRYRCPYCQGEGQVPR